MDKYFSGFRDDYVEHLISSNEEFIITFDANILLNLYRYEPKTRDAVIALFKNIKKNSKLELWLSHQVALEFNENRFSAKDNKKQGFDEVKKVFGTFNKQVKGLSKIGGKTTNLDKLRKSLSKHIKVINEELSKFENEIVRDKTKGPDRVFNTIYQLFSGHVGEPFDVSELERLYCVGEERYQNNVPPGYEDSKKTRFKNYAGISIDSRFGDLIMWFQIIEHAKAAKKPVVLVIEDVKGDWLSKDFSRVRPELINEHYHKAGQCFYAVSLSQFDYIFKDLVSSKLTDKAKNEIASLTESDSKWLDDIIKAFEHYGGTCTLKDVYEFIKNNSERDFPVTWETIVRRTIYNHCSQLSAFLGGEDRFEKLSSGRYRLKYDL